MPIATRAEHVEVRQGEQSDNVGKRACRAEWHMMVDVEAIANVATAEPAPIGAILETRTHVGHKIDRRVRQMPKRPATVHPAAAKRCPEHRAQAVDEAGQPHRVPSARPLPLAFPGTSALKVGAVRPIPAVRRAHLRHRVLSVSPSLHRVGRPRRPDVLSRALLRACLRSVVLPSESHRPLASRDRAASRAEPSLARVRGLHREFARTERAGKRGHPESYRRATERGQGCQHSA